MVSTFQPTAIGSSTIVSLTQSNRHLFAGKTACDHTNPPTFAHFTQFNAQTIRRHITIIGNGHHKIQLL
jgi:hypothetical protein